MPKRNNHTPPPARDPIITCSHASVSTSGEQVSHVLDIVPVTPRQERATLSEIYILVSPILGPIIVDQFLKSYSHNVVEFRRKFA